MKVKKHINLIDSEFRLVTLRPGDEVPAWAVITNPDVLDDAPVKAAEEVIEEIAEEDIEDAVAEEVTEEAVAEAVADEAENTVDSNTVDYSVMKNDELRALLEERGLDVEGKKADLVARLIESDNTEIDVWAMNSEELHKFAKENQIDISGATNDVEVAALIEQAKG